MKSLIPIKRKRPRSLNRKKVSIYIPPDLERIIVGMAKDQQRSFSNQVIYLLSQSVDYTGYVPYQKVADEQ